MRNFTFILLCLLGTLSAQNWSLEFYGGTGWERVSEWMISGNFSGRGSGVSFA